MSEIERCEMTKSREASRVLVLGTSVSTRGGIAEVIKRTLSLRSNKYSFKLVATHIDARPRKKLFHFVRACLFVIQNGRNYDICHVHFSQILSLCRKAFLLLLLPRKVSVVAHYHAAKAEINFNWVEKGLIRFIGRRSKKFIVLSEMWSKALIVNELIVPRKLVVIYNPAKNLDSGVLSNVRRDQILFAGTLNKRKNYSTLIEALALLPSEFDSVHLVLAGNGEIDKASELAHRLDVHDRVHLPGWLSSEEVSKLYRNSAVFCLPSFAEGLPMALIDAWSNDLPVVCSQVGGIADVLRREEAALIVDPGNASDIADCLAEALANGETRLRLIESGRRLVQEHFALPVYLQAITTVYSGLDRN